MRGRIKRHLHRIGIQPARAAAAANPSRYIGTSSNSPHWYPAHVARL